MPHVFDQEQSFTFTNALNEIMVIYYPSRYDFLPSKAKPTIDGNLLDYGNTSTSLVKKNCVIEMTSGEILFSGGIYNGGLSCAPNVLNAGNYYNNSFGNYKESRSVCPNGWKIPNNTVSYGTLLESYNTKTAKNSTALVNLPLSFVRAGSYSNGTPGSRGSGGDYRSSASRLSFTSGTVLSVADVEHADYGYSLRYVRKNSTPVIFHQSAQEVSENTGKTQQKTAYAGFANMQCVTGYILWTKQRALHRP